MYPGSEFTTGYAVSSRLVRASLSRYRLERNWRSAWLRPEIGTWQGDEFGESDRDALLLGTRNILGSTMALFKLSPNAASEIERVHQRSGLCTGGTTLGDSRRRRGEQLAGEIQDRNFRDPEGSRQSAFVEGRPGSRGWTVAMGYKTRVSKPGPEGGVDIMASPDGFGFESSRIWMSKIW